MRFRLRTLLIFAAVLPPILSALWPLGLTIYRRLWPEPLVIQVENDIEIVTLPLKLYIWPDGTAHEEPPPDGEED